MRRMGSGLIAAGLVFLIGCASSPDDRLLQLPTHSEPEAQQHAAQGIREFQAGSWTQAQRHFERAIEADPTVPQTHYNLGLVMYRLGKGVAAEQHFIKAAEMAPLDPVMSKFRQLYVTNETRPESPQERNRSRGNRRPVGGDGHGH